MKGIFTGLLILVFILQGPAQKITILTSGRPVSLRGLCVVNEKDIWVSGSAGTVGHSSDGGIAWNWIQVPRYEKSDFRDIHAFSETEAVIMGITLPAVILYTKDGGKNWTTVFEDSSKSVFLDAMDFSGDRGIVAGDPDQGKIFLARTLNRGQNWEKTESSPPDTASAGEAFFASSGTNIKLIPVKDSPIAFSSILVSGGSKSCIYIAGKKYPLHLVQGKETTGANSIAVNPMNHNQAFIVGGDFSRDSLRQGNSLRIQLDPFVQTSPITPPLGYRSCVDYIDGQYMVCCGTSGTDISTDGGLRWKNISPIGFHVCGHSANGKSIILAGPKGTIARLAF